jgi:hypothetical protein
MEPSDRDPYKAVWQMSEVGDVGKHDGRRVRWVAGIVGGLVGLFPFALFATAAWGWWTGEPSFNAAGFAFLVVGLAVGLTLGGYVATSND